MNVGEKSRIRILFVALLAALAISFWLLSILLSPWLAAKNTDDLYGLLDIALLLVIIGVVIEEWELFWKTAKLIRLLLRRDFESARKKARKHAGEAVASAGFLILVFALAAELGLDPLIETRQKSDQLEKAGEISKAESDAATANTKAASLLAENVQLEHELAPRNVNLVEIINALRNLPRVPLFVSTVNADEPKEAAGQFLNFERVFFGPGKAWVATARPLSAWQWDGVVVSYMTSEDGSRSAAQNVAETICESLNSQGIDAKTEPVRLTDGKTPTPGWDSTLPENSVLIGIGRKPNLFWENKVNRRLGMKDSETPFTCTEAEAEAWVKEQWRKDKETPLPSKR